MAEPLKVTVPTQGPASTLALEGSLPKELRPGSSWALASVSPELALFVREGAAPEGLLLGSLKTLSLAELFGHLLSSIQSGRLTVTHGAARRQVVLRDGEVVFAVSSLPHERLGAAVQRRGLVSAEQVNAAVLSIRPGERLGAVLTREGLISPAQLYEAMSQLVVDIVLGLFEMTEGSFLFVEGNAAPEDAVRLASPTRELVLEGLRRSDEAHRLSRRWPDGLRLRAGAVPPPAGAEALVAAAGRGTTVGALRPLVPQDSYGFYRALDAAVTGGALVLEPAEEGAAAVPPPPLDSVLQRFADLVARIAQALLEADKGLTALRAYLQEPGPRFKAAFAGVALSDEGFLDVERVQENLQEEDEAMERARTYEALGAFVAYALFCAQNAVDPAVFEALKQASEALRQEEAPR